MTPEKLEKYTEEKIMHIFNLLITTCQRYKQIYKRSRQYSVERNNVMGVALAFNNLLSQENVNRELEKISIQSKNLQQKKEQQ